MARHGGGPASTFTCGLLISCARCAFQACANPEHEKYAEDPHDAMRTHKADAHSDRTPTTH